MRRPAHPQRVRNVAAMVDSLGGMAQKRQLVRLGARDHDLTRAVRDRSVLRVRNGWYTTSGGSEPAVRAVRVGGRLTGLAAIEDAGGWVVRTPRLEIAVPRNAARLRSPWNRRRRRSRRDPAVVHWDAEPGGTATRVSTAAALRHVILHESLETAVAAVDWSFHAGELDLIEWETLLLRLPRPLQRIRHWVDRDCGSLPESLARTRLRRRGLRVRSQVPVAGTKAIDLVIEDAVALEVDGERHHRDTFTADRQKDLEISLMGLHAMRPSADIVFRAWPELERAVLLALAARGIAPGIPLVAPARRTSRRHGNSGGDGATRATRRRHDARGRGSPEFP
jgi:very-short-patch-repair endonuclease